MSDTYCEECGRVTTRDPSIYLVDGHYVCHQCKAGRAVSMIVDQELARLRRERDALRKVAEAAKALRERMGVVHNDYRYHSVWSLAQIHNGPYTGPTYVAEAKTVDAALAEWEKVKDGS